MTKLYYDDPLKSAWMAREFGVKIATKGGAKLYNLGCGLATAPNKETGGCVFHQPPYYVSPDSLHIFEPMDGDLYEVDVTEDVPVYYRNAKLGDKPAYYKSRSSPYHQFQIYKNRPNGVFKSIIQRDGKAFFMPEAENG